MRELFRLPNVQAARTAASYQLLSMEALHFMGVDHIQRSLEQKQFEIVFKSGDPDRFPHLKAYLQGDKVWWIVVGTAMYPQTPSLGKDVASQVLRYARTEDAKVFYAPLLFINTKSQNISLPSKNGRFTVLFDGFIPVKCRPHR